MEKITKTAYFEMIKAIVAESTSLEKEDILKFVDTQIEQINAKAAKAKERAAEKKETGDALRETIKSVLTSEYQSIASIMEKIDVEDLTPAKVSARLTALIGAGEVEKESVKGESGRKQMCYRLVG